MSHFVSRVFNYSCKHLKNQVARIYVQNSDLLESAGMTANTPISVTYERNKVTVKVVPASNKMIMQTARGALLELRDKATGTSFSGFDEVVLTVRKGVITFTVSNSDQRRLKRDRALWHKLATNQPLDYASLFSGVNLLTYNLMKGFKKAGLNSQINFANDIDELALTCSLEGNPIWKTSSPNAMASTQDIRDLPLEDLPQADVVEVALPCINQSKLCRPESRDIDHPVVGSLFIHVLAVLKVMNPSIILFENPVPFESSVTLKLIKKELSRDYKFETTRLVGHSFGDFEERERSCIVATPHSFPSLELDSFTVPTQVSHRPLSDILEPVPLDSPRWKRMEHVKTKANDPRLNFTNKLYSAADTKIATLIASYHSPKVGAPMIAHPTNPELQRQFTGLENSRIRRTPASLEAVFKRVIDGTHSLVTKRGNTGAVHRMCGNSVSPMPWRALGHWIASKLIAVSDQYCRLNFEQ